jgi:TRAP-type C4-dicarboxylate transport system substrate-binding protein
MVEVGVDDGLTTTRANTQRRETETRAAPDASDDAAPGRSLQLTRRCAMSKHRSTTTVAIGVVACITILGACGGASAGRAGGETRDAPRVLTFAQPIEGDPPEQLQRWADEVERQSTGTLKIEFENGWRSGEVDYEAGTLADVSVGKVDLAWVGARVFDTVGVESFQALVAPMLVESHDLQAAVFEAGIPGQMLDGVEELGVVGVGVLPGPMRKLLGKEHPYVTADDFGGDVIGLQASAVAEQTFAALGATTTRLPSGADISEVDGYEQQLDSIWGNHYELQADFVTANVNLWPRPLVIVASADGFESLDADQQDVLRRATANAIPHALEASRDEDAAGGESLCRAGMTFATASAVELDALRAAMEPVYASLGENRGTADFLAAINELKNQAGAAPDAPECTSGSTSVETGGAPSNASELDGKYTATLTGAEISASGCDTPNFADWHDPDDEISFELTLSEGSLELLESVNGGEFKEGFIGTYNVFRDQIELQDGTVPLVAHWTLDGPNLVFEDIENGRCDDEVVWTTHPWVLVEEAEPPATHPAEPPHGETSIPNGIYTTTVTRQDALETCPELVPDEFPGNESTYELTLDDGFVTLAHESGGQRDVTLTGSYTVFRDRFTFEADTDSDTFAVRWAIDDNTLTFTDMEAPFCGYDVVWTSHPFVLVDAAEPAD